MKKTLLGAVLCVLTALPVCAQKDLEGNPVRHQLRTAIDLGNYSYSPDGKMAGTIDLWTQVTNKLAVETLVGVTSQYGRNFGLGGLNVIYKKSPDTYFLVGGVYSPGQDITSTYSEQLEVGHVFYRNPVPERGFIRGLESDFSASFRQYGTAANGGGNVTILQPRFVLYLPRDTEFTIRCGAARTALVRGSTWAPNGGASLKIQLLQRFSISPTVSFGSETFNDAFQLRQLASQSYGFTTKLWTSTRNSVEVYYFRTKRTHGQEVNELGISYTVRF